MATTLVIDSFSPNNIRERTRITSGVDAGATELAVESTAGYTDGDIIYVGTLSREGCERAVVDAVNDETTLTLTEPLGLAHIRFDAVTSVLGDLIHVYRAANVDGSAPALESFTVLATRSIDADQLATYYTDSSGDSSWWYRSTYYNATTGDETDLDASVAARGDDFGHYASLSEIRSEAGFLNNYNIRDSYLDQKRRAAESEINASLANGYTVPFNPVPATVNTLTIALTVGLIWADEYGANSTKAKDKLADVRQQIKDFQSKASDITDDDGNSLSGGAVSFWPDETAPRAFVMGEKF